MPRSVQAPSPSRGRGRINPWFPPAFALSRTGSAVILKLGFMIKSPLSPQPPIKLSDLSRQRLLAEIEAYFGVKPPSEIVECDYALWRCTETGFEFVEPAQAGGAAFYEWISRFPSYYPGRRWEYGEVERLMREQHQTASSNLRVLDVGCGTGDFLRGLDLLPNVERFGIDLNRPAIETCRKHGLRAFCGTVAEAQRAGFARPGQFDYVTAFHCLEHVPDPVGFVRELAQLLAVGGHLLISTPYSPMCFEADWFDVLNHPPHHLGRWNIAAFRKLAALLDLTFSYHMPPARPAWIRAVQTFRLLRYGPQRAVGKRAIAVDLLFSLPKFLSLWRRQRQHQVVDGRPAADVILIAFKRS